MFFPFCYNWMGLLSLYGVRSTVYRMNTMVMTHESWPDFDAVNFLRNMLYRNGCCFLRKNYYLPGSIGRLRVCIIVIFYTNLLAEKLQSHSSIEILLEQCLPPKLLWDEHLSGKCFNRKHDWRLICWNELRRPVWN